MSKISIILPTYNGGQFIEGAIKSVIVQSFFDWELIVIDDGSVDDTAQIVSNYRNKDNRILYIKNEKNLGISKSLNKGLSIAKGQYIARIDDDDEWIDPDKLLKQLEFMEDNPSYVLVGTGVVITNLRKQELYRHLLPETDNSIRKMILSKNCFVHSSVLFRKDKAINSGGYDSLFVAEDYDLWLKLGTIGSLYNLPIYAVRFTLRGGSLSSRNAPRLFISSIKLMNKNKDKYPNYFLSLMRGYIRLFVYGYLGFIPLILLKFKIRNLYKKCFKF